MVLTSNLKWRGFTCVTACRPGPLFLAVGNTAYRNTIESTSKTIVECQKECLDAKGCRGIDWTQQAVSSSGQCKLVGELARIMGPSPGTTHYNVYRNFQCATRECTLADIHCYYDYGYLDISCRLSCVLLEVYAKRLCTGRRAADPYGKRN